MVVDVAEFGDLVDKLIAAGVNMTEPAAVTTTPGTAEPATAEPPLAGMSVVVTGAMTGPLEALSRN
ncbi:hypothetical protein GCM10010149_48170 [Nonomuraea roseoviolacea subsp. roseoviolacea]|uniref:hypothetical protein n=1 Tax=Nonomuraea roseoviolacea TaxID=103837 RepID=UPI0031CE6075